jgi:hypothetical protein
VKEEKMEHEDIRKLIVKNGGYLTLTQLKEHFKSEDPEILEMNLTFLVDKNHIRKADFQATAGPDICYFIPIQ